MSKQAYLHELKRKLHGLPEDEIENALAYVEEFYDEAANDEEAYQALGSPAKFAAQIKAEFTIKQTSIFSYHANPNADIRKESKSAFKNIWIILLGILSLPVSLPLACVIIALIFVLLVLCAIPFIIVIAVLVAMIGSIAFMIGLLFEAGLWTLTNVLLLIAGVLICTSIFLLGIGILFWIGSKFFPWLIRKLGDFFHQLKGEKNYE